MSELAVDKVIPVGNVGSDPDVKSGGKLMANFSAAVNESLRRAAEKGRHGASSFAACAGISSQKWWRIRSQKSQGLH